MPFHFAFTIENGEPRLQREESFESRGTNCLILLKRLVSLDPARFERKTGIIYYADEPPAEDPGCDLQFCTTKLQGQANRFLPFPCPYSLSWPEVGLPDADALTRDFLSCDDAYLSDKTFWLGADTHWSRCALVRFAAAHPAAFDCHLMVWNRANPHALTATNYQSLRDHRRYKYLVDCQGCGYSARLKWLLASGRPVFVVDRAPVEFWHERLVAWQHYIPVAGDLSDLLSVHRQMEASPHLYAHISREAKRFAEAHLTLDQQLRSCLDAVPA